MIKNYLLIAFRNLYRNSFYSSINIIGLAVGIACSILILLWVADELSFDRFHENYGEIHKVYINQEFSGKVETYIAVPYPAMSAIKSVAPGVKHVVMTNYGEGYNLAVGETRVTKMGLSVSEDFFNMFSFKPIYGDATSAIRDPSSIVITQSTAQSLFGDINPIGKLVLLEKTKEFKVGSVIEDIPEQSTIRFDFFIPYAYFESSQEWVRESRENWRNNSFHVYVQLEREASVENVNQAIKDLVSKNEKNSPTAELFLHPMSKWRLYTNFTGGKISGGLIDYVTMFSAIAVFILIIACINFMNLATARSEKRAREVGIRKSVGSRRQQLILQFLGESITITFLGFSLAIVIVELMLPAYNTLVSKQLFIEYSNPALWIAALSIVLLTGIIAGSYPAFYLSGFQPVKVLKGKVETSHGASTPRKVLVTLQFGFSIFLIIGTLVVYQQIMHVKSREIGYDRENLMLIWSNKELETNFQTTKDELLKSGVVKAVCKSSAPITRIFSSTDVEWQGKDPNEKVSFVTMATEYDFAETMGIKMIEGRDFSRDFAFADTSNVIVNKAAVELMGVKDPIGATLRMWGDEWTIIGVTENIIMGSPYVPVDPTVMVFIPDWSSTINVRLNKTSDIPAAVAKVETIFKKINPSFELSWRFADAEFETKFASINLISNLAGIFSSLAILITCLGLFGLAAFTAEQRRKELGIRKVLGATVSGLILLISKDFSRLIMAAFVIASPLAWWFLNSFFLEQYPYRISIAWWIIPVAGFSSLLLAMLIVGAQAFRAAQSNPVDSLRRE
jgi:putative ABC transport system permease protein